MGVASNVHIYVSLYICTRIEASFHKELGKDLEAHDCDTYVMILVIKLA